MASTWCYTQQDPIGIAGGLNLYGFANGDPVNFSDPFGLCPESKRDDSGNCPGGLSVAEWDATVNAVLDQVTDLEIAGAILGKLDRGEIHGAQSGTRLPNGQVLSYDAVAVTSWMTEDVYVNRFPRSGLSTFARRPGDLAFAMVHEYGHVLQVSGASPLHRRAMLRAYNENPTARANYENEANQLACANVVGYFVFAVNCR